MNRLEKCLLAFILTCATLTVCAQCYHAGHSAAYKEIAAATDDNETCSTDTECEANQR